MAAKLPYVNQPGSIIRILEKVRDAQTPERFTSDFLQTKLGFRGGNYLQFIPLAKKMGLLESDGRPTNVYRSFRNGDTSKSAMAKAIRSAYKELFERNERADKLTRDQLKGIVVEISGLDSQSRVAQLVCQTFELLKKLADFDAAVPAPVGSSSESSEKLVLSEDRENGQEIDLNIAYTFNLVLPKSDDPAVFNAIFRSLREHLLRK